MWRYKSPIGVIKIVKDDESGYYYIEISLVQYGPYLTPEAAANDVYEHKTGCKMWDKSEDDFDTPCYLTGWISG